MTPSVLTMAVTRHRPAHLFGYDFSVAGWRWVRDQLRILIEEFAARGPSRLLSGMALGVDQIFAEEVLAAGQALVAYIPFSGQDRWWPPESRTAYQRLVAASSERILVSTVPSRDAFLRRNEAMVEACDVLIAVWNGKESGGTRHCLDAALAAGRPVIWVEPSTRTVRLIAP